MHVKESTILENDHFFANVYFLWFFWPVRTLLTVWYSRIPMEIWIFPRDSEFPTALLGNICQFSFYWALHGKVTFLLKRAVTPQKIRLFYNDGFLFHMFAKSWHFNWRLLWSIHGTCSEGLPYPFSVEYQIFQPPPGKCIPLKISCMQHSFTHFPRTLLVDVKIHLWGSYNHTKDILAVVTSFRNCWVDALYGLAKPLKQWISACFTSKCDL